MTVGWQIKAYNDRKSRRAMSMTPLVMILPAGIGETVIGFFKP